METFLQSLAKAYALHYDGTLSDVCFVFPGKRAGSFFLRHMRKYLSGKTAMLPAVSAIADFIETLSGRVVDSRIDQICLLYSLYRRMQMRRGAPEVSFDKFHSWADTMLRDFNDVEMYCVNPEALFRNVKLLKNIRSNYLTDEQMKVMRQYFGYNDLYTASEGRLWQHYGGEKPIRKRFLTLFDSLGELYDDFCADLEMRGLTFSGQAYTQALKTLQERGAGALPYKRVVLAGFNALSTVEFLIFKELARLKVDDIDGSSRPFADYYWDCTGVPLSFDDNIGRHFVEKNRRIFPSIYDLSASDCNTLPEKIESIAAPSGVAQAKIAGRIIDDIMKRRIRQNPANADDAEVAVVLPDENMLLPMLYSMPAGLSDVNLTMGYPFTLTTVATFVALLETYQKNLRLHVNAWEARTADVDSLLSSPLTAMLITPRVCSVLAHTLRERRRTTVPVSHLIELGGFSADLFAPLGRKATSERALEYLLKVLTTLDARMEKDYTPDPRITKLDHTHVLLYIEALRRLSGAFGRYNITAGANVTFRMAMRLLSTEVVRFEGEPLRGVQVMGPLETRCLDFRYLVIPSMNERVYPRRLHTRSFIPAVVRRGFGMATTRFQESIFTYYFYRMISRAQEVYLIYDSRTEGRHSGSPSRFILQLEHLYAKGKTERRRYRFELEPHSRNEVSVAKTPEIMQSIEAYFTPGSGKALSASSLNRYISCPLRFYIQNIRGVSRETKPIEGLQGADQGSIVHKALEEIYLGMSPSKPPFEITGQMLLKAVADQRMIREKVIAAINSEYYLSPQTPDAEPDSDIDFFVPMLCDTVTNVLRHDAVKAASSPFTLISAERKSQYTLSFPDGMQVNFLYIVDRMECAASADADTPLCIVDYKTGGYNVESPSVEALFESDHAGEALQLLLYALLEERCRNSGQPVSTLIYDLTKMGDKDRDSEIYPRIEGKRIEFVDEVEQQLLERLHEKLTTLRDVHEPFRQAPEGAAVCRYCPFAQAVCGIVNKEE